MENVNPGDIVKVVQKYSSYISSVCRKYFIAGGTSEDLYEEGVIGLLEACKNYNGDDLLEEKFDSFAKVCIKRQIFDAIKKTNTQKNKVLNESLSLSHTTKDGDELSKLDIVVDRNISNDPLDLFIAREKIEEQLKICEKELSDFEKLVFKHYIDGEKQSEIAKNLNKQVKVIDNTLQRIKTKLK